ncbi:ATP-grasp domain-containing protein [Caldalkalibacillus mannanilyticus]|uniref:ATP-grasp domain-containing protein n=1 Tax=Caldalkalibacillus mannanilyticus TaxID=1418 RepID=UPI000468B9DB|nr:ATP-grasp domain-containing protein [Caldalkalibacillus mannanilyticus]
MKKGFVFIEDTAFVTLTQLAERTKQLGYTNYVISRILEEHERERIDKYNATNPSPLFEHVIETDQWDFSFLQETVATFERETPIAAFLTLGGLFNRSGLLGAYTAQLAQDRGLPSQSPEALYRTNNKYLARDALKVAGVPTVNFGLASNIEEARLRAEQIGFPVVLKPINGCASQLVMTCQNEIELVEKFNYAIKQLPLLEFKQEIYTGCHEYTDMSGKMIFFDPLQTLLIEEYISGREASIELLATEDEMIPLLIHDKVLVSHGETTVYEHLLTVPPVRFTPSEVEAMKQYAVQVAKATGIKNSLCHIEIRYDETRGPQLLEINPRVGGMLVTQSLKTMIEFDALEAMIHLALGTFPSGYQPPASKEELHAMFTLYPPHAGFFEKVEGFEELKEWEEILQAILIFPEKTWIQGDHEEIFLLMCWTRAKTYDDIVTIYEKAKETVKFHIKKQEYVK